MWWSLCGYICEIKTSLTEKETLSWASTHREQESISPHKQPTFTDKDAQPNTEEGGYVGHASVGPSYEWWMEPTHL